MSGRWLHIYAVTKFSSVFLSPPIYSSFPSSVSLLALGHRFSLELPEKLSTLNLLPGILPISLLSHHPRSKFLKPWWNPIQLLSTQSLPCARHWVSPWDARVKKVDRKPHLAKLTNSWEYIDSKHPSLLKHLQCLTISHPPHQKK